VKQKAMTLRVHTNELTITLPLANVELVGIRDVIDASGLEEVYAVLRNPFTEEAVNWSRRFKSNQEKLASDSVVKVAEVVRDLWRREQDSGVSSGEKRMLLKSRQLLESEVALALGTNAEQTAAKLDEVLASALAAAPV
jgi:CarD family transcriptional regulator